MIQKAFFLPLLLILFSCKQNEKMDVQKIVDNSIKDSGGELYPDSEVSFISRNIDYSFKKEDGKDVISRTFTKDSTEISDIYGPNGFKRHVNGDLTAVPDSMATRYYNSINSVYYFAKLPYGLNDSAVNKELVGEVSIKGKEYYKIKVTFDKQGGGEDFEDIFMYWFNTKTFKPDYLAYQYFVDGGGFRFREAYNERYVNGIRFVDYKNYKPIGKINSVHELDDAFQNNGLKQVSEIRLENIKVNPK